MLVENYHQFPSALNFGSLPQFFARFRAQQAIRFQAMRFSRGVLAVCCAVVLCVVLCVVFMVSARALSIARPLLPPLFKLSVSSCLLLLFLNLPGWRWGSITQNPLVAVSRPLHSGVCETRQDIGLPVLHSEISDSGLLRTRGDQQYKDDFWIHSI